MTPGALVRWPGMGISECSSGEHGWPPFGDACWYPIDLLIAEQTVTLQRIRDGVEERVSVAIEPYPYPQQSITVDEKMVHPPEEQLARIREEQTRVSEVWKRSGPYTFSLPFAPPLQPMPKARAFGSRRIINGEPRSPHMGIDLTANTGTPVLAAADGEVALAAGLYFAGNAVILDHGARLFTMYFHLHEITVRDGDLVTRGQPIGTVGATGRVTGAHLHFGVRWNGARVDPSVLFAETEDVPTIGSTAP